MNEIIRPNKSLLHLILFLAVFLNTKIATAQTDAEKLSANPQNDIFALESLPNGSLTPNDQNNKAGSSTAKEGDDAEVEETKEDLFDLDLEDLGDINVSADPVFEAEALSSEVVSVDGTKSTIGQSPAAIFVLTEEMIRRSGVRTIPDALRLVPGVQVARLNSQAFSVSIRGFSGPFNNKVLVQVDGRIIYNQTYGGVLWDVHELILEDIERIEVIRGPGATIWGENAFSGVINVVTKSAEDTLGNYFTAGAGTEENEFYAFSIGRKTGGLNYRVFGKFNERNEGLILDPLAEPGGFFPEDGGFLSRVGYRSDYVPSEYDRVTTIVDLHRGGDHRVIGQEFLFDESIERNLRTSGGYALIRWQHTFDEDHDFTLQASYDRSNRDWIATLEKQDNFEIDLKDRRQINEWRERVSGFTWRLSKGRFFGADFDFDSNLGFVARDSHSQLDRLDIDYAGIFIQEKWTHQKDKWFSWFGTKFGWNSINDLNFQPSARTLYVLDEKSVVWGSASRAVRLPTRFDAGVQLEDPTINGFSTERTSRELLLSEEVIAYEIGYRLQPNDRWSWELTGFFNDYGNLLESGPLVSLLGQPSLPSANALRGDGSSQPPVGEAALPAPLDQLRSDGHAYGAELNGNVKLASWWDLSAGYSYLNLDIDQSPGGGTDFGAFLDNERSPDHMVYFKSLAQIGPNLQWDATVRYVDRLGQDDLFAFDPSTGLFNLAFDGIPSYLQLDTRLNYQINDRLDLTVVGRNLLNSSQPEFGGDLFFQRQVRSLTQRSFYMQLSWKTGRVSRKTRARQELEEKRREIELKKRQQQQSRTLAARTIES